VHESDHYGVGRIWVGLSWELHCLIVRSSDGGEREDKGALNSTTKVSFSTIIVRTLHDSDHDDVARIFVALSYEL